ncbi:hypothetical protein SCHIN_v1c09200 [Spiroplasma chinense]|uniref:Cytosolic endo-beta-N-acetylglucosaminidase TIM barrel domain-containing protein n=1 Tax=Spiroplasma chinense TaxID=216932 RepID=A0A5B9Y4V0_9MOLU|nr:hypothetical protein [Spiroplasma chinense]QEH62114.1 hypothetical protein SCHIN_v1c09200 [Spiroplasma chinense]
MKKLLFTLTALGLIAGTTTNVVSCYLINNDNNFLENLPDFDWTNSNFGDGIDFNNYNEANALTSETKENYLGKTNKQKVNRFVDYNTFSTGFQWSQNILKQAVTGVPLNKGFMPNGNFVSDFGVNTPSQRYRQINSILDWDPNKDMDAKYNKSGQPLIKSTSVATKLSPEQNEDITFMPLGFTSRKHRTYDNTIVGTKNPYENTPINYQYITGVVNWSGSWLEGPIVPPPADIIEAGHQNGTKVYGNIFLDGWHGLSKNMLKDFLKKDEYGNFLIVDKLIEIADYMGFDGWFFNNEANGSMPDGWILKNSDVAQIIKDFNNKTLRSEDSRIQDLDMIFYTNEGSLKATNGEFADKQTGEITTTTGEYNGRKKVTKIVTTFSESPERSMEFLDNSDEYTGGDVMTIIDEGVNSQLSGFFDFKNQTYLKDKNGNFDKNKFTGFTTYLDNGTGVFAGAVSGLTPKGTSPERAALLQIQANQLMNDIQYSGSNLFISKKDIGKTSKEISTSIPDSMENKNVQFLLADPRVKFKDKEKANDDILNTLYDYSTNGGKGYNSTSFGIGSLMTEKTIINDDNNEALFKTNFSTGSGIKFVSDETSTQYPWSNRRLVDTLPSYRWQVYDKANQDEPLPISDITGAWDYDVVYKKGNSIAIGGGFDETGAIVDAKWDTNKTYYWDIMGTNLSKKNRKINFVYKDGDNADVKLLLTTTNQSTQIDTQKEIELTSTSLGDGWKSISYDLNQISSINQDNKLSKIGLSIKPNETYFKLNVGELSIENLDVTKNIEKAEISKPSLEYIISRNNQDYNIRFGYTSKGNNISYYEIYTFFNDRWYRVGETTQSDYFLKDLKPNSGNIKIGVKPIDKDGKQNDMYSFDIEV